jgi:hypothetical protein
VEKIHLKAHHVEDHPGGRVPLEQPRERVQIVAEGARSRISASPRAASRPSESAARFPRLTTRSTPTAASRMPPRRPARAAQRGRSPQDRDEERVVAMIQPVVVASAVTSPFD